MTKILSLSITRALVLAIVVLLVSVACYKYIRQPQPHVKEIMALKEILKEAEPAYKTQDAEVFTKELIPLVETAAGREFQQIPKIKLISRNELTKVLLRDFLPQFKNMMPKANSKQILKMAENQAKWTAPTIIGKYGFVDRVLYLIPGNVYPILKLKKISKEHTQAIMKVVIAHELTHALQDQQINLKQKLDELHSLEESEAFNATIEGHAVFIQDLVGKKLHLDEAMIEHSRMLAAGQVMFDEPMLEMQYKIVAARFENIYLGGRKFIEYHHNKGGNRKVWEILAAPPIDGAMILEPETYSPTPIKKRDYAGLLKGVEKYFGSNQWKVKNIDIPKMMLHAYYNNLDPKEKDELISKIAHVQALELKIDKGNSLYGNTTIIELKDKTYGPKFISTIEKIATNNAKELKNSKMYRMDNLTFKKFDGINADVARKLSYTLKPAKPANGEKVHTVVVRICIGNIVLEIIDSNIGLKNEQIIEIAELIFKRWQHDKLSYHLTRHRSFALNRELLEAA